MIGRLAKDSDVIRYKEQGFDVLQFVLAVDRYKTSSSKQNAKDNGKQTADFILCKLYGKNLHKLMKQLKKGNLVGVTGMLRIDYVKKKEKNYTYCKVNNLRIIEFGNVH